MRAGFLVLFMVLSFPLSAATAASSPHEKEQGQVDPGRQRRVLQLKQSYDLGLAAMEEEDYRKALDYFSRLMTPQALDLISPQGRAELAEQRGKALVHLGRARKALAELEGLDWQQVPPALYLRLQLVRARALNQGEAPIAAYELLRDLDRSIERHDWTTEDHQLVDQVTEKVNLYYGELLRQAGRSFDGGLYEEALAAYDELIQAIERQVYPAMLKPGTELTTAKIYYRLAQAYFMAGDLTHCMSSLKRIPWDELGVSESVAELERNACFLLGLAQRKDQRYDAAIASLEAYLSMGQSGPLEKRQEANWELGLAYYEKGDLNMARVFLEKHRSQAQPKSRPARMAALYLARLHLAQGNYQALVKYLEPVASEFEEGDPLRFEAHYLLGEGHYYCKDYEQAIAAFEASLPTRNLKQADWAARSLYNLGWSYLKQAERSQRSSHAQKSAQLAAAEKAFQTYLTIEPTDRAYLALAQVYLTRGHVLNDLQAYEKVESLLGHEQTLSEPSQIAAGLLLRAEAAQSYSAKEALYERLCSDAFRGSPSQVTGFYYRGLNFLAEARRLAGGPQAEEAQALLHRAIGSLSLAGKHLRKAIPQLAALAWKYSAEALFLLGSQEALEQGLALCEVLVTDDPELLESLPDPDELWYMRALFASRLMASQEGGMRALAEASLQQVIEQFPQGKFAPVSYKLLATLYYQASEYEAAEPLFLSLARSYPRSPQAGDAWFWASECAEWLKRDRDTVRNYRKQVFEAYPDSTHASEAYYAYYGRTDYLRGKPEAVAHLADLPKRFPSSPRSILAHYLLGMQRRQQADFAAALEYFEQAAKRFTEAMQARAIPVKDRDYYTTIYYRSRLELGKSHLDIVQRSAGARQQVHLEYARSAFETILDDFANTKHPYASLLIPGTEYSTILDEAQLGLASGLRAAGDTLAAAELLDTLLAKGGEQQQERSYIHSRAHYQRALLYSGAQNYEAALESYENSETAAGSSLLSTDELLQLWLDKAEAQLALKHYTETMRILSQIINHDSDSPLRIHAMYLRGLVYEQQGKPDLALRQLRTCANKSGIWATYAQRKLDTDYGFN